MSRDSGFYGLDGPNQSALLMEHEIKKARAAEERQYEHELEVARTIGESIANSSGALHIHKEQPSWNSSGINIINSNKVKQTARCITNITLSDQQFKELLEVIKNKD